MTWATGTSAAPRLRTYEEAAKWEAQVVPIRNKKRTKPCKPLGRRDCTQLTIRKEGRKIIICLYGRDRLVYHSNGKIDVVIPYGGVGITDASLLWSLLGVLAIHFDKRSWLHCSDGKVTGWFPMKRREKTHRTEYPDYANPKGPPKVHTYKMTSYSASLVITPLRDARKYGIQTYRMLDVKHPERSVINRAGAKDVRDRYSEFAKLLRGVTKLEAMALEEGSGVYFDVCQTQQKARGVSDSELFAYIKSKDTGQQMKAAQLLVQRHVEGHYQYAWKTNTPNTYHKVLNRKGVTNGFYKIIYAAHKKEAYTTEVVTNGVLTKNRHHV